MFFLPVRQGDFDWSPKTQGLVLGAFFYGYLLTQIIGGNLSPRQRNRFLDKLSFEGRLAERFGAKWVFGGSIFLAGVLTLLTPMAAKYDVALLIVIRLLIGAFEVTKATLNQTQEEFFELGTCFPECCCLVGSMDSAIGT